MPIVAIFYGIMIRMFWDDHNPPHFHAIYGNAQTLFQISNGERIAGALPPAAERLVRDRAQILKAELEDNWFRAINQQELLKIAGPDQE